MPETQWNWLKALRHARKAENILTEEWGTDDWASRQYAKAQIHATLAVFWGARSQYRAAEEDDLDVS
jgi:hypothetical protein